MVNFQYLEYMLRGAIEKYEEIIRDQVKKYFDYPNNQRTIDRMTLGKLGERYSKYTNNPDFKKNVDVITESRNKLAHAMFVKAEHLAEELGEELVGEINKIYEASELAADLADLVVEQTQHIYFDSDEEKWVKT